MARAYGIKKIISLIIIFLLITNCKSDSSSIKENAQNFTFLEEGDLICRLGKGYFSNYFRLFASGEKKYSHIGIISIEDNFPYVYHAEASELTGVGGVKKDSITEFIKDIDTYSFFKLNLSLEEKKKITTIAKQYFLNKTKFDLEFNNEKDDEVYCTEFVANCINKGCARVLVLPNLVLKNKSFYGLDDIYKNPICTPIDQEQLVQK